MPTPTPSDTSTPAYVQVPNGIHGNGVIYVQPTSGACSAGSGNGANPFDDWQSGALGQNAQWGYKSGIPTYYNYFGASSKPDCEADAFVSDNPGSGGPTLLSAHPQPGGVVGQVTIGSANDVVVTGNINYLDCGSQPSPLFDHGASWPNGICRYNAPPSTTPNDVLGLMAFNYILVNHPVKPNCRFGQCQGIGNGNAVLEPQCLKSQRGVPAAAICDPGPNVTIDAAILALQHSFAVDNFGTNGAVGPPEGTLTVYGVIDQKWRGAVGIPVVSRATPRTTAGITARNT